MTKINRIITLGLVLMANAMCFAQNQAIIPVPVAAEWHEGTFSINNKTTIGTNVASLRPAAEYLSGVLAKETGTKIKVKKSAKATIVLALNSEGKEGAYSLHIDKKGVRIEGCGYAGVINGIATLRQMLPELHYADIIDEPAKSWRGMELDCSRHFFSKDEVKELLDVLAFYKINKFHWHLTDDQGWRVEIKKYPLLTEKGGWRTWNNQDSVCFNRAKKEDNPDLIPDAKKTRKLADGTVEYGGFYTQQDIREIVEYASVRGIDVIPEIDMPGHSLAAIANYDGLSCFPQIGWGKLFTTPLCPGKDKVLAFCKDVWKEIFELFPSKYVHIGGDEVDMKNWKKCPDCQKRIKEHNLKDEHELQAWFTHDMEKFFNANGKTMIAWDETVQGGLSATQTVMWWRSWAPNAPKETTSHGNNLICTPNGEFYLDYDEDGKSIGKIYNFNTELDGLSAEEQQRVLGVQGNLWTEWVPTRERMFHMAFPRMIAVAELGWSSKENKCLDDFKTRLSKHFALLQKMNVTYRIPDLTGFYNTNVFVDEAKVKVNCADPSAVIRYTTDGSIPQNDSKLYTGEFTIDKTTDFTFRTFDKNGRKGDMTKCRFIKEEMAPAVAGKDLKAGLSAEWHEYTGADCAGIEAAPVNGCYEVSEVAIPDSVSGNIGLIITGYIEVPADGIYTFALLSDDGSYLKLDGNMVVDNDKEHSPREVIGQHAMKKGLHQLYVRYFDHNGGQLRLNVFDQNGNKVNVNYKH